ANYREIRGRLVDGSAASGERLVLLAGLATQRQGSAREKPPLLGRRQHALRDRRLIALRLAEHRLESLRDRRGGYRVGQRSDPERIAGYSPEAARFSLVRLFGDLFFPLQRDAK